MGNHLRDLKAMIYIFMLIHKGHPIPYSLAKASLTSLQQTIVKIKGVAVAYLLLYFKELLTSNNFNL